MGDIGCQEIPQDCTTQEKASVSTWNFGSGIGSWQATASQVKQRTGHLYNNREMSDLILNACDENWWFGDTVKDFNAHKFLLATASPVFHKILYDWTEAEDEKERQLRLDSDLEVTLTLVQCYDYQKLELEGVPPIAAEALLEYIYKDSFKESDFDNGYSRNLLWRLWHASKALEMDHLHTCCTTTLDKTMCEDTVFWDLNYAIKYKALGTEEIRSKVLKLMETLEDRLFEHPNFVWLDHAAINELLNRRRPNSCEAMIIYNNLLRWSLYQIDRSACCELDNGLSGAQIPIHVRLEWIGECRNGAFEHVRVQDLEKYLNRGLEQMPWTEMSQADFLVYVVNARVVPDNVVFPNAVKIMEIVVNNPERLQKSAFVASKPSLRKALMSTSSSGSNSTKRG